jgi:hypothetical protein
MPNTIIVALKSGLYLWLALRDLQWLGGEFCLIIFMAFWALALIDRAIWFEVFGWMVHPCIGHFPGLQWLAGRMLGR